MKRFFLVAVAALCFYPAVQGQEGALAPTAPVVPAPWITSGNSLPPSGGYPLGSGTTPGQRSYSLTRWSPFRNPATPVSNDPATIIPAYHGAPVPTAPTAASGTDASCSKTCGPSGCGRAHRGCLEKMKQWLCYHDSNTELPKMHPTACFVPLQGMFPCPAGCSSCADWSNSLEHPFPRVPPRPEPVPPTPSPMQQPTQVGGRYLGAGSVTMPPRGTQGLASTPYAQTRYTQQPTAIGQATYNSSGSGASGNVPAGYITTNSRSLGYTIPAPDTGAMSNSGPAGQNPQR
jgi:hypothetical protein